MDPVLWFVIKILGIFLVGVLLAFTAHRRILPMQVPLSIGVISMAFATAICVPLKLPMFVTVLVWFGFCFIGTPAIMLCLLIACSVIRSRHDNTHTSDVGSNRPST